MFHHTPPKHRLFKGSIQLIAPAFKTLWLIGPLTCAMGVSLFSPIALGAEDLTQLFPTSTFMYAELAPTPPVLDRVFTLAEKNLKPAATVVKQPADTADALTREGFLQWKTQFFNSFEPRWGFGFWIMNPPKTSATSGSSNANDSETSPAIPGSIGLLTGMSAQSIKSSNMGIAMALPLKDPTLTPESAFKILFHKIASSEAQQTVITTHEHHGIPYIHVEAPDHSKSKVSACAPSPSKEAKAKEGLKPTDGSSSEAETPKKHYYALIYPGTLLSKTPQASSPQPTLFILESEPATLDLLQRLSAGPGPKLFGEPRFESLLKGFSGIETRQGFYLARSLPKDPTQPDPYTSFTSLFQMFTKKELLEQLTGIESVTAGTLNMDLNQGLLSSDMVAQMGFDSLKSPGLKEAVMDVYTQNETWTAAHHLPASVWGLFSFSGLTKTYDLFKNHLLTDELQGKLDTPQGMISGFGLDFRKDILGLLDREVTLAILKLPETKGAPDSKLKSFSWSVLLTQTPALQGSLDKIVGVIESGLFPASVQPLTLQGQNFRQIFKDKPKFGGESSSALNTDTKTIAEADKASEEAPKAYATFGLLPNAPYTVITDEAMLPHLLKVTPQNALAHETLFQKMTQGFQPGGLLMGFINFDDLWSQWKNKPSSPPSQSTTPGDQKTSPVSGLAFYFSSLKPDNTMQGRFTLLIPEMGTMP